VPDIVEAAAGRGIRYLGITDHIHPFTAPDILRRTRVELDSVEKPIEVFLGCEVDVVEVGKHLLTDDLRRTADFVAIAANHFHTGWVAQPEDLSPRGVGWHFLEMFRYACSLEFADVIVHPMVVFPGTFDPTCLDVLTDDELSGAIDVAKANSVAMEISPRALARDQMFFRMRFYSLCKEAGLRFSIGTDSHRLASVGRTDVLAPIISELKLEDDDIWIPRGAPGGA